jgi:hypothetical protein
MLEVHLREVGKLAVVRDEGAGLLELQLLGDVGDPARAEALPRQDVDVAGAQHGPEHHLEGAGVRGGNDAQLVIVGDSEHLPRAVDHRRELLLADLRAVRSAHGGVPQEVGRPAGALGAGSGGEVGSLRSSCRLHEGVSL